MEVVCNFQLGESFRKKPLVKEEKMQCYFDLRMEKDEVWKYGHKGLLLICAEIPSSAGRCPRSDSRSCPFH